MNSDEHRAWRIASMVASFDTWPNFPGPLPSALCALPPAPCPMPHALCPLFSDFRIPTSEFHPPPAALGRQLDDKFCTLGNIVLDTDKAVVIGDNRADNRQSQAHTGFFS